MDTRPFSLLSLCSGCAGAELGIELAVPTARTVCYVEVEAFACEVLVTRMEEGWLDEAPVWSDLASFDGTAWRGKVDCIAAGFPCQPVSVAGKRRGQDDERWLWPDIARLVCEVRPRFVFLENVPGLLVQGFGDVLSDLAAAGYDAEWGVFSAAEVGAPHLRRRVFILAYASQFRWQRGGVVTEPELGQATVKPDSRWPSTEHGGLAHTRRSHRPRCEPEQSTGYCFPPAPNDLDGWRAVLERWPELAPAVADGTCSRRKGRLRPAGSRYEGQGAVDPDWAGGRTEDNEAPQPAVRRVADGLAHRVDRLRALGNGVVPIVAAVAFRTLYERLCE